MVIKLAFVSSERAALIAIIDGQRRDLESRDQAQQEAVHVAETFATAIQSFEERLVQVEQTTASELTSMKSLLIKQSNAMDLILHSLGISLPPSAPNPSLS